MLGPPYGFVKQATFVAVLSVLVALSVALVIQSKRLAALRLLESKARVEAQGLALEAAGWKKASQESASKLAALVPRLEEQTARAKKAEALLALASTWSGHGKPVAVPCPPNMEPSTGDLDPLDHFPPSESAAPLPSFASVTPHVQVSEALSLDDAGGLFVAREVRAKLSVGESWSSEWEVIEEDEGSRTSIAPELSQAWREFKTPPYRIEGFVGLSLGTNGAGIVGGASGGRGRLGWFALLDYGLVEPSSSRIAGGFRLSPRR